MLVDGSALSTGQPPKPPGLGCGKAPKRVLGDKSQSIWGGETASGGATSPTISDVLPGGTRPPRPPKSLMFKLLSPNTLGHTALVRVADTREGSGERQAAQVGMRHVSAHTGESIAKKNNLYAQ